MESEVRLDRVWKNLDKHRGAPEDEAAAWVECFNLDSTTLQAALGMVHDAFGGRRFASPVIARALLRIAGLPGEAQSDDGKLALQAKKALLYGPFKTEGPGRDERSRWWPIIIADPDVMTQLARFLINQPGLYVAPATDVPGSRDIVERFLMLCWRYYWWQDIASLPDRPSRAISEALQANLFDLTRVVKEGGFNPWLQPCAEDELDQGFVKVRMRPLLEAYLSLLPKKEDGVTADWDKVAEANDGFSRAVVRYLTQRRLKLRQEVGRRRAEVAAAEKAAQEELVGAGPPQARDALHPARLSAAEEKRKRAEFALGDLNEELAGLPQF